MTRICRRLGEEEQMHVTCPQPFQFNGILFHMVGGPPSLIAIKVQFVPSSSLPLSGHFMVLPNQVHGIFISILFVSNSHLAIKSHMISQRLFHKPRNSSFYRMTFKHIYRKIRKTTLSLKNLNFLIGNYAYNWF